MATHRHDPEVGELQRRTYRLVVESERALVRLEDHLTLLQAFVDRLSAQSDSDDADDEARAREQPNE